MKCHRQRLFAEFAACILDLEKRPEHKIPLMGREAARLTHPLRLLISKHVFFFFEIVQSGPEKAKLTYSKKESGSHGKGQVSRVHSGRSGKKVTKDEIFTWKSAIERS